MIELFEQDIKKNDRQSSKGNQLKWENNDYWYKADYLGYEGLAEYIISNLLKKSTLLEEEFVLYDLEDIRYKSQVYHGVKSRNFLEDGWQIITLERLFKTFFNKSLNTSIYQISSLKERLIFLVNQVERITGLKDFGIYMNKLFTIDALFLNEDRHTYNIAVLMNSEGQFSYCPIFDNGAGVLSDLKMDYPMDQDVYTLIPQVKSKTLCTSFDDQLDISEQLFYSNLHFNFTRNEVVELLDLAGNYPLQERKRVEIVLNEQMRKYQYLFS